MLTVRNLFHAIQERSLLSDLSFDIQNGEMFGVIGPNGSGKSSLIKILSGEWAVQSGGIMWNDLPLDSFPIPVIARERAYLKQNASTSHGFLVNEMVMMGRYPHYKGYPSERDVHFVEDEMERSELDSLKSRTFSRLSGGEQQRVALSRSFVQLQRHEPGIQPRLLLLDEPLNHLDMKHAHELLTRVRSFVAEGNCAAIVLHDIRLAAEWCDKVMVLNRGKAYAVGKPEEVITPAMLRKCFEVEASVSRINRSWHIHIGTDEQTNHN